MYNDSFVTQPLHPFRPLVETVRLMALSVARCPRLTKSMGNLLVDYSSCH